MTTNEMRLELLDIADDLGDTVVDNGPMGEYRPYSNLADRIRNIARELREDGQSEESRRPDYSDFRDVPWDPR